MSPDAVAAAPAALSAVLPGDAAAARSTARPRHRATAGTVWAWVLAAAVLGVGVYVLTPVGLPRDALYLAYGLGAVVAVEAGARRHRPPRTLPWHLVALGTLLWVAGDALRAWTAHAQGGQALPALRHPAHLLGYAVVGTGLLLLRGHPGRRDRAGLLDSASVTVALGVLAWVLLARPTIAGHLAGAWTETLAAAYPLAAIVLAGLMFRLVSTPGARSRSVRLLVLAVALLALADTVRTALDLTAREAGVTLEPLWLLAYAATGAAALHPSMVSSTEPSRPEPVRFTRTRLAILALAALVAPAVLAVQAAFGLRLDVWAVVVGSVALLGLVVARMKLSLDQIETANREREAARLALAHQAAHDGLTGLPNRAQALYLMRGALNRAQRSGALVGVLVVDLDGCTQVDDTLGHAAGDEVLVVCGRRMQGCVRDGDVVARLDGDEFVVLLEPVEEEASAVAVADRMVSALSEPVVLANGREVSIGASIGVAVAQDGRVDPDRLLREADVAVHRARLAGPGRTEVFDVSLRRELDRRQRLQAGLTSAISDGDLELRHEPVLDLRTLRLAGYEARVSWRRAGEDELTRRDILPVAERTELVCDLDSWVLRTAAQQAARIPAASMPSVLEVPLSGRHLHRDRVVADVVHALAAAALDPARMVLVVDPADLLEDADALAHLGELRCQGVRICADGFGTHEGPTDRWAGLPIDLVRIDTHALAKGPLRSSMLLRLTVETAHTFGWAVVGSGVCEVDDVLALREVGCQYVQGPIPRRTVAQLSSSRPRVP